MTQDGWREVVMAAWTRYSQGDPTLLDLLSKLLAEQDAAKNQLQSCCGTPWPEVVKEILDTR